MNEDTIKDIFKVVITSLFYHNVPSLYICEIGTFI